MPMDQYDYGHSTHYDKVINVYRNSNIEDVIKNVTKNLKSDQYPERLSQEINDTIKKLKGALDVLDYRTITCISARICPPYAITSDVDWYLVNVWRGGNSNKI